MREKLIRFLNKSPIKKVVNRETISYAFWGVATSVLNIVVFYVLDWFGVYYRVSNLIAIILAKVAAYFSGKFFVFHSRCESAKELVLEVASFIAARIFTMLIDYFGLILLVDVLLIDRRVAKILMTLIVVIANYFLSKLAVFKRGRKNQSL
jgi:putative flippase GtrA